MQIIKNITLATVLSLSSLSAHNLWINSFESFAHKPGHTTVGLGWGHSLPIDDRLNSPNGAMKIEEFSITSPSKEKTKLELPKNTLLEPTKTSKDFEVYNAQIALQKIALKKESTKGTYLIHARSKANFHTKYIDTKDRTRFKPKSKDQIEHIKEILFSVKFQTFASSYLTLGEWQEQKARGKGLEIIPKTDLSNVKVGDLVKFEVLFNGKPLSISANKAEYISAISKSFGEGERFALMSPIYKGEAQLRVQSKGQWRISCEHKEEVTKDGALKDLYGKADLFISVSSLTFNVK